MTYSKEYNRKKKQESRARDKLIYTYHAWEKMPNETDKEFKRRFTKRVVVILDEDKNMILDPFGKILDLQIKSVKDVKKDEKIEHIS
jgi:hypothetical protein